MTTDEEMIDSLSAFILVLILSQDLIHPMVDTTEGKKTKNNNK